MHALFEYARSTRAAAAAVCAAGALLASPAQALFPEDGFADVARVALPAYVDIATTRRAGAAARNAVPDQGPLDEFFRDFFGREPQGRPGRQVTRTGAGFVIDASGVVVTNYHVIADASEIEVIFHDGTSHPARILGVDDRADLAALKIEADRDLPSLSWGDSDAAEIGDWALAIGNPFGMGGTLTLGIISARGRNINAGPYVDFIQTDAAINRGNSGGPLLNVGGEVIGINTAIFSPNGASIGLGFAIPSNAARPIVEQLVEFGRPRRGWLGVRIQGVSEDLAERLGMARAEGALIAGVAPEGPAGHAGVRAGDVVLALDGRDIPDARALPRVVAAAEIDAVVDVEVWRDGRRRTLRVRIGELTDAAVARLTAAVEQARGNGLDAVGLQVAGVTPELRRRFDLPSDAEGVVVTEVDESGPAAARGIEPGDLVVAVGGVRVRTPADVETLLQAAVERRPSVEVVLQRGDRLRWVVLGFG